MNSKTLTGFCVLREANVLQRLTQDTEQTYRSLWLYPGKSFTNGILNPNAGTVYCGEPSAGPPVTPDVLQFDSPPILYEVPAGSPPLLLFDVVTQGTTAGDAIFFKLKT